MKPSQSLRAEARDSASLAAYYHGAHRAGRDASGAAEKLAKHHDARARLFDRCAEAAERIEGGGR